MKSSAVEPSSTSFVCSSSTSGIGTRSHDFGTGREATCPPPSASTLGESNVRHGSLHSDDPTELRHDTRTLYVLLGSSSASRWLMTLAGPSCTVSHGRKPSKRSPSAGSHFTSYRDSCKLYW